MSENRARHWERYRNGVAAVSFQANLDRAWIGAWLDAVAAGYGTVSRRPLRTIERHGGLEAAIAAAQSRSVHLAEMMDETGKRLVAASRLPFRSLC